MRIRGFGVDCPLSSKTGPFGAGNASRTLATAHVAPTHLGGTITVVDPDHTERSAQVCAICPTCAHPPERTHLTVDGSIVTATFLCPSGHLWLEKWSQAVAGR
jgi:hypothetical protein